MQKINKNIIGIVSGITLVAVSVIPASAEDSARVNTTTGVKAPLGVRVELNAGIKAERIELKNDNMEKRADLRTDAKAERGAMQADIKTKMESMRVDVKAMRDAGATPEEIKVKVDAVRASNQVEREAFKAQLEVKRQTLKDDIKKEIDAFKEGKKIKLGDAAKMQVKQRLDTTFTKLSAAIGKIAGFDKRLSDEIASRKAKGLDVVSAEINLELARRSLEEAKVSIAAVNTAVTASIDSGAGASKEAIKAVINKAVEAIKTTKSKYGDVLKALPKVEAGVTASSTVQTN
jgi:hypothetical protein